MLFVTLLIMVSSLTTGVDVQGHVSAMVMGDTNLGPIPKTLVRLYSVEQIVETHSDDTGAFVFHDVRPGKYQVVVTAAGYQNAPEIPITVSTNSPPALEIGLTAANPPGPFLPAISYGEIRPRALAHLVCTIKKYTDRRPLSGVTISLSAAKSSSAPIKLVTNVSGQVEFLHLNPGAYILKTNRKGFANEETTVFVPRNNTTAVAFYLFQSNGLFIVQ